MKDGELQVVGEIADQVITVLRSDPQITLEQLCSQFPEHCDELERLLPTLALMAKLQRGPEKESIPFEFSSKIIGRSLGEFGILREIARGGMGVVFEAVQKPLGRHVALKAIMSDRDANPIQVARFKREAQAAAQLHHTNIVPVFAVGNEGSIHYIAMQYIRGVSLQDFICDLRSQEEDESAGHFLRDRTYWNRLANIGVQIAEALQYAHDHQVLHRDIKPSNILLENDDHAWLTDFGLAALDQEESLTETGNLLGTLRYMAPECFQGKSERRSDVYSLGLTLYELASLKPAFAETERGALIRRILDGSPPKLSKLVQGIPRELTTIIDKCVQAEPHLRYATAGDLKDDLKRFLNDEQIRAQPLRIDQRVRRWCRKNRLATALTSVVVFLFATTAVVSTYSAWSISKIATARQEALAKATSSQRKAEILAVQERKALNDAEVSLNRAEQVEKFLFRALRSPMNHNLGPKATVAQVLEQARLDARFELKQDPRLHLRLLISIAETYASLGDSSSTFDVLGEAEALRVANSLPHNPYGFRINLVRGRFLRLVGDYKAAFQLIQDSADEADRVLEESDELYIALKAELASILDIMGESEAATNLSKTVVQLCDKYLPPENSLRIDALKNLAVSYQGQGKATLAVPLLQDVAETSRILYGDAPAVAQAEVSLAGALRDAKRPNETVEILERVLSSPSTKISSDHEILLRAKNNLAFAYADLNRLSEAVEVLSEVREVRSKRFPPAHPELIMTQWNLGGMLRRHRKYDEAIIELKGAHESAIIAFGKHDWRSLAILGSLISTLESSEQDEEAIKLALQAVAESDSSKLGTNREFPVFYSNVGAYLCGKGYHREALAAFQLITKLEEGTHAPTAFEMRNHFRWQHCCRMSLLDWPGVVDNAARWQECLNAAPTGTKDEKLWLATDLAYALLCLDDVEQAWTVLQAQSESTANENSLSIDTRWNAHIIMLVDQNRNSLPPGDSFVKNAESIFAERASYAGHMQYRVDAVIRDMIEYYSETAPDVAALELWKGRESERQSARPSLHGT